jgi:hypothetical protein
MSPTHRRIEAATAAMRLAEAAMSQLVEQDPALGRVEATRVVLQQLRIALAELQVADEDGDRSGEPTGHASAQPTAQASAQPTAQASGQPTAQASGQASDSGGQPLPDRATEGRPPIDA